MSIKIKAFSWKTLSSSRIIFLPIFSVWRFPVIIGPVLNMYNVWLMAMYIIKTEFIRTYPDIITQSTIDNNIKIVN